MEDIMPTQPSTPTASLALHDKRSTLTRRIRARNAATAAARDRRGRDLPDAVCGRSTSRRCCSSSVSTTCSSATCIRRSARSSLVSYLPSGWLADRLSPRWLICFSLLRHRRARAHLRDRAVVRHAGADLRRLGLTTGLTFWAAVIKRVNMIAAETGSLLRPARRRPWPRRGAARDDCHHAVRL